ncbi:hypothetical protein DFJ74DRAFT_769370 [Hyaloraphidium curvatum]|nr:hypothetical protein DFJ74DRAFT_769370 [Hyaloraphidium curvatum]
MPPRATLLTSRVIQEKEDYPPGDHAFLVPHECIRRDLRRGEYALARADAAKDPWKVYAFARWYSGYYCPALHAHHDAEEEIFIPFYSDLGEGDVHMGREYTHKRLLELMDSVLELAKEACALADEAKAAGGEAGKAKLSAKFDEVKARFTEMADYTRDHLDEEERFWPPIIERHGEDELNKAIAKLVATDLAKKGDAYLAFKAFGGGLMDAISPACGYAHGAVPPSLPCAENLAPWAKEDFADKFYATMAFVPRIFIFPSWRREYVTKWRTMIESVGGDVNVLQIESLKEPESSWCSVM